MIARFVAPLLLVGGVAAGQPAPDPRAIADRLALMFVERGAGAFLDALLAETPLGDGNARLAITDVRPRLVRGVEMLGTALDHLHAGQRSWAPGLVSHCYVVRFRRQPLLLSLRLYDAPAGWNVLAYNWHTHDRVREWDCAEARE